LHFLLHPLLCDLLFILFHNRSITLLHYILWPHRMVGLRPGGFGIFIGVLMFEALLSIAVGLSVSAAVPTVGAYSIYQNCYTALSLNLTLTTILFYCPRRSSKCHRAPTNDYRNPLRWLLHQDWFPPNRRQLGALLLTISLDLRSETHACFRYVLIVNFSNLQCDRIQLMQHVY
jgi:hypothetical protein